MDTQSFLDLVSHAGAVTLLAFFVIAGFKGWIVWGREFSREVMRRESIEKERDEWRELALRGTNLAESLTQVQERRVFKSDK